LKREVLCLLPHKEDVTPQRPRTSVLGDGPQTYENPSLSALQLDARFVRRTLSTAFLSLITLLDLLLLSPFFFFEQCWWPSASLSPSWLFSSLFLRTRILCWVLETGEEDSTRLPPTEGCDLSSTFSQDPPTSCSSLPLPDYMLPRLLLTFLNLIKAPRQTFLLKRSFLLSNLSSPFPPPSPHEKLSSIEESSRQSRWRVLSH